MYPKRLPSENSLNISRLQPPKQSKVTQVIYSIIPHNYSEKKLKAEILLRMGRGYIIIIKLSLQRRIKAEGAMGALLRM